MAANTRRTSRPRRRILHHLSRSALAVSALSLASCRYDVLNPAGPVAAGEKLILLNALTVMLAIVIPVIIAVLAVAWWFRAGNSRARRLPSWAFSGRVELVTWSIPILVVVFLGGMTWVGAHELDPGVPVPGRGKTLTVQVVSLDWKWLFIYPDQGVASVNRLVLPVGTPVRLQLTSGSVMSAFFVPRLGSLIYTMNGMVTPLNLRADQAGVYDGGAAHFSGDGFSDMNFKTAAVAPADFDAWVATARGGGPALDARSYEALARPSSRVPPFTYATVQPGLFDAITSQLIPPAPGPSDGTTVPASSSGGE